MCMLWREERRKTVCVRAHARFDNGGQVSACFLRYPFSGNTGDPRPPPLFVGFVLMQSRGEYGFV